MVRTGQAHSSQAIEPPQPRSGMSWWWLAPCLLAIAALSLFWRPFWRLASSSLPSDSSAGAPIAAPSQLGFSASHEGSDWRLVWNREAVARLNAVGAMLSIHDGGVDRLQFLSSQDLAAGAIFYVPRTSDLTFNLKVALAAGSDIEEQIRVLGATPDNVAQLATGVRPRRIGEATRDTSQPAAGDAAKSALRQFRPPSAAAETPAPALEAALPDVKLPATPTPQIQQASLSAPQPPRPAVEAPKPVAPTAPIQQAALTTPQPAPATAEARKPSTPLVTTPQQMAEPPLATPALNPVTHVDPAPIRAVPASWPRGLAHQTSMEVRILVRIDTRGRVIGTTPVQRTVTNFPFVDAALAAARSWTFSPALQNGNPVNSETVLTFRFTP